MLATFFISRKLFVLAMKNHLWYYINDLKITKENNLEDANFKIIKERDYVLNDRNKKCYNFLFQRGQSYR